MSAVDFKMYMYVNSMIIRDCLKMTQTDYVRLKTEVAFTFDCLVYCVTLKCNRGKRLITANLPLVIV